MIIIGIESSCDETAVAVVKDKKEVLSSVVASQIDVHTEFGGVVPEVASRIHVENISYCIEKALKDANITMEDVDAVAVTQGPGLIGCLHVGVQAAKTLAFAYHKPLVPVHHLAGHIYANELVVDMKYPVLALVVSGGNTELVYMKDETSFEILGETQDDAIGEAYDKVGRVLHLPYPGGPVLDKMAHEGTHSYTLPKPLDDGSYNFSFSGLKSAVINLKHNADQRGEEINGNDLACSFQDVAMDTIASKALAAAHDLGVKQIIVAGGVSANKGLREKMSTSDIPVIFPPLKYCTDNAAMIASAASIMYKYNMFAPLDLSVKPDYDLEAESVGDNYE